MSKKEAMEMRINLDESPRPQLLQGEWVSLNGPWSFLFDDLDQGLEKGYQEALPSPRQIIVPFAYQTSSSGIGDTTRHDHVWYQKDIVVRDLSKRHILHFEGADYHLTLFVNGRKAGEVGIDAAIAAEHKIPVILVSGDDKVCAEASEWIPGVVTCEVKKSFCSFGARIPSLEKTRALITRKTEEAVRKLREIPCIKLDYPVKYRVELVERRQPTPWAKHIDGRTYEMETDSVEQTLLGKN